MSRSHSVSRRRGRGSPWHVTPRGDAVIRGGTIEVPGDLDKSGSGGRCSMKSTVQEVEKAEQSTCSRGGRAVLQGPGGTATRGGLGFFALPCFIFHGGGQSSLCTGDEDDSMKAAGRDAGQQRMESWGHQEA